MSNRVVITGLGVVAPNGTGRDAFWKTVLAGESGVGFITRFDAAKYALRIAGEVKDFDLSRYVNGRFKPKRLGQHTQFALAAAHLALADAALDMEPLRRAGRLPVLIGVSTSAIDLVEGGMERLLTQGPGKVSPFVLAAGLPHAVSTTVAESLGVPADTATFSSACQGGVEAMIAACRLIREGRADIALAGGADAPITPLTVASFIASGLVPVETTDPRRASRPFDRDRAGGIMAEGAGMIVFESLDHARERGATPYAEVLGAASRTDTPGDPVGAKLRDTMTMALANAGQLPDRIDYVCAHGPSDPETDRMETEAIKAVFGRRAYRMPVSSIKGVTANPLAAQGPMQAIACALAMRDETIPPTANYEHPDPACDLDYVPNRCRMGRIRRALFNVHGLGGGNSTMVLRKAGES